MALYPSTTAIESILDVMTTGTPYLALYTTNPTAADVGTEVTGGSYARQAITFGSTSGGSRSNTATITFTGLPTATMTHYGIRTAATGGTLRGFGLISATAASLSGDELVFEAGDVQVTVAGS